jgi:hypothetical protein
MGDTMQTNTFTVAGIIAHNLLVKLHNVPLVFVLPVLAPIVFRDGVDVLRSERAIVVILRGRIIVFVA